MRDPDTVDETYAQTSDGTVLPPTELRSVTPDPEEMIAEMDISVGDTFHDTVDDLSHFVSSVVAVGDGGVVLLDDPDADTDAERKASGISTDLANYYAKWRCGDLEVLD